jgi:hypothetical protein
MGIRMSGRGLRICGGDEEGMRDEIRICTPFDGFNMGSTEGRKDIVLGTGPGKGSHKTLKKRVPYCTYALDLTLLESRRLDSTRSRPRQHIKARKHESALEASLANLSSETYSLHTGVISAFRLLEVVFKYNNNSSHLVPAPCVSAR